MDTNIELIKKNITNYEIHRSFMGWSISEIGGSISMLINNEIAAELLELMDKAIKDDEIFQQKCLNEENV